MNLIYLLKTIVYKYYDFFFHKMHIIYIYLFILLHGT